MKHNLVIFWGNELNNLEDPIPFKNKRQTYLYFFGKLNKFFEVFICRGLNNIEGAKYRCHWKYQDGDLVRIDENVVASKVYDLSAGSFHPQFHQLNVVKTLAFKTFSANKWLSYLAFTDYFPKTLLVNKNSKVKDLLPEINSSKVILKPFNGLKGNGIYCIEKSDVGEIQRIISSNKGYYLIQEYIDTNIDVDNFLSGVHDLRCAVINREIVWSHIRQPAKDDFRSNVALGGSIREVDLQTIPTFILEFVGKIISKISEMFDNPIYSIDMGITKDGPKIIEFNSRLGFPRNDSKYKDKFIDSLVSRLVN